MCANHQQDPTTTAEFPALNPLAPEATAGSCCSPKAAGAPTVEELDDLAECPVMTGTPVNKAQAEAAGLFRDHKGQRYWFCCAACGPMFDADPEEYAAA
jgi:YHS domain-containing protein